MAAGMPSEVSARILRARNKASSGDTSLHNYSNWVPAAEGGREMPSKQSTATL